MTSGNKKAPLSGAVAIGETYSTVKDPRQFNPNAVTGTHNYTPSKAENDYLASIGWRAEGIGWYGVKTSSSVSAKMQSGKQSSGALVAARLK